MLKLIVEHDTDQHCSLYNPRTDCDNLGTIVCWHRNYNLGDEQPSEDPSEWLSNLACEVVNAPDDIPDKHKKAILKSRVLYLPLYLFDHSGITISCEPFSCSWDSGQVGYIYVTRDDVIEEYGEWNDETIAKAREVLQAEIQVYDMYIRGDVWMYRIEANGEELECLGGYLGEEFARECGDESLQWWQAKYDRAAIACYRAAAKVH